jgi:hypothetical protein
MTNIILILLCRQAPESIYQSVQRGNICIVINRNRKCITMKNEIIHKIGLIALAFGSFVLLSCVTSALTGQTIRESRDVSDFDAVSLAFSGDVFITQGSPKKVEIEADKSSMEVIETKIDGNTLVLKTRNGHWGDQGEINVYITMPDVSGLSVSGSGDMICKTPIHTDEIKLEVSGSGSVTINKLESPDITAVITGSGDITLAGTSKDQSTMNAVITGSGSFKAEELQVGNANVNITGSGSASVSVLKELETNITGSGSVLYKGSPVINANTTGSGKTRSMD